MPRLPNGAKAPVKKKKPAPKRKPSTKKAAALPGYKVPKKLLKNTKSNQKAGRPSLAKVMAKQDARIAAAGGMPGSKKPKPKTRAASKSKASSDWEAGLSVRNWARGQKKPWQK